ncbi:hypothetical protein HN51_031688, partial [Arachis hypogaea]
PRACSVRHAQRNSCRGRISTQFFPSTFRINEIIASTKFGQGTHAGRPHLGRCPCRPGLCLARGWIVAARPLCHLQYPVAYLSRLQRILPAARSEKRFKASPQGSSALGASPTARASGGPGPLLLVGKRAAGARVASSPDSDLEAFSHNPTHGRADIEGSKSNVAMNAWLPQASYPCGNFSDTSSFKFRRSKGSLGHAFTVRIHVPPQPNSPPDNVFRPDRPAEASLGSKKRGNAPPPIHGIIGLESSSTGSSFPADSAKPVPLAVVSLDSRQGQWESLGFPLSVPVLSRLFDARGRGPEGPIPNPSPDRHATTRSRHESSSSSPPTADGFGAGTPVPSPQSQSFSRGYGSILPTSLAYIVPSTRGCSPWRPDAVMSTTGRDRHSVLRIFKGRRGRTGHHATCGALPAAGPYLRLSRFQGGQADRLTHVQVPFTWNLSPLRPSKFSFEYLLLPPRSAPTAAPPGLAPQVLQRPPRPPTHRGIALAPTAG